MHPRFTSPTWSTRLAATLVALWLGGCADSSNDADAGIPFDQCVSSADRALLDGTATDGGPPLVIDGGVGVSTTLRDVLWGCAQDTCPDEILSGSTDQADACMRDCYVDTSIADLSSGCQDCWTLWASCGAHHCATDCLGTDPAVCDSCMTDKCVAVRDYCTGL